MAAFPPEIQTFDSNPQAAWASQSAGNILTGVGSPDQMDLQRVGATFGPEFLSRILESRQNDLAREKEMYLRNALGYAQNTAQMLGAQGQMGTQRAIEAAKLRQQAELMPQQIQGQKDVAQIKADSENKLRAQLGKDSTALQKAMVDAQAKQNAAKTDPMVFSRFLDYAAKRWPDNPEVHMEYAIRNMNAMKNGLPSWEPDIAPVNNRLISPKTLQKISEFPGVRETLTTPLPMQGTNLLKAIYGVYQNWKNQPDPTKMQATWPTGNRPQPQNGQQYQIPQIPQIPQTPIPSNPNINGAPDIATLNAILKQQGMPGV